MTAWPSCSFDEAGNADARPVTDPDTGVIYDPETGEIVEPWESATEAEREAAAARLETVKLSQELHAAGVPRSWADRVVRHGPGVSVSAVSAWRRKAGRAAPGRALEALLDNPRTGRPPAAWREPGADVLWRLWCTDYLREEAPTATAVHRRLADVAAERGWALPHLGAFKRRTDREFTRAEIVRARGGALAAMDLVPHQTRTVAGLKPLDIVNGDGRRFDVTATLPRARRAGLPSGCGRTCARARCWPGAPARPRTPTWYARRCMRSSRTTACPAGSWSTPPAPPRPSGPRAGSPTASAGAPPTRSCRACSRCSTSATRRPRSTGTPPAGARGAGGPSRSSARLPRPRQPYRHPSPAGRRAGTGRSPVDRPETHRMRAVPWEVFIDVLERAVVEHNAREGRQTEAAAGRSFDQTWAEEVADTVVRRLSPSQAAILLLAAEDATIDNAGCLRLRAGKGAGLPANRYHHPDLVERAGERVVARFDPEDLHGTVHVFDAKGRYVCAAGCLMPAGFADAAAAKEWEAARRRKRRARPRAASPRAATWTSCSRP